jgi:hypothetical protein
MFLLPIIFVIGFTPTILAATGSRLNVINIEAETKHQYTTKAVKSSQTGHDSDFESLYRRFDANTDLNILAQRGQLAAVISLSNLLKSRDGTDSQLCNAAQVCTTRQNLLLQTN